jgi:YVTN family beta-propeller protein
MAAACSPSSVPVASARHYLFAPSFASNLVTVFDLDSGQLAASIPAQARGPCCANATPDGKTVFVVDGLSPYVSIIDVASLSVTRLVKLPGTWGDRGVPVQRDGNTFWLSELPEGNIDAIDVASQQLIRSFPFISNTVTVSRDGQTLYTANLTSLPTGIAPTATTFTSRSPLSGEVLGTAILPLAVDNTPLQLYVSFDDSKVYVQMLGTTGTVHVVDVSDRANPRYVKTIHVGSVPIVAGFTPDGSQLWFPNSGDGTVAVLDTASDEIVHRIDIGVYVAGVAIQGQRAYISISPEALPLIGVLSEAQLFAALIPGAALTPPSGSTTYRPLLGELPGEILTFDADSYEQLPVPAMPLPSVSQIIEVVATRL